MKIVTSSALALSLLACAAVSLPGAASAEPSRFSPTPTPTIAAPGTQIGGISLLTIPLGCSSAGASDVASRHHSLTNTSGHSIPKGTVLSWTASNKGSGKVTLTSDLAPNGTVDVSEPGQTNGYTCTGSFIPPNVDLVLKSVSWSSPTVATVVITNASPWRDAGASTLRVQRMKCLSSQLSVVDHAVGTIAKGASITVNLNLAKTDADYLQATANATGNLAELSTANNGGKSPDFGSNKSCTPQ